MSGKTVTAMRALRSCLFSEAASAEASTSGAAPVDSLERGAVSVSVGAVMGCLGSLVEHQRGYARRQ